MKRLIFFCLLLIGFSGLLYADRLHVVKQGEVLSTIAKEFIGSPVYPPRTGSLAKLLALNPSIQDPDHIRPGQEINLGDGADEREPASTTDVSNSATPAVQPDVPAKTTPTSSFTTTSNGATPSTASEKPQQALEPNREIPHGLFAFAGFAFSNLNSTDSSSNTTAQLNTSRDLTVGLGWAQIWSDTFATSASFSARNLDFQPSTNANKSLTGTDKTLFRLSLDAEEKLTSRLEFDLGVGMGQELFLHGLDTSSVTVDGIAIPQASLTAKYEMYRQGSTSLGGQGLVGALFPASFSSYDVKSGEEFGLGIFIRHQSAANHEMHLTIGYFQRNQDTSILKVKETGVSAFLNWTFPLFEGNKK